MKPSPKQFSAIKTASFWAIGYLTEKERKAVCDIASDDMNPEDITVLVGDMLTLAYKDWRDGFDGDKKAKVADEVRSIIKQYEKYR